MAEALGAVGTAFVEIVADFSRLERDLASGKIRSAAQKSAAGLKEIGDEAESTSRRSISAFQRMQAGFSAFSQGRKDALESMKSVMDFGNALDALGSKARTLGIGLSAVLTAPIAAVTGLGLSFNALQERALISFTTMLGSGTKAKAFLENMKDFAAKTPFEFPDLVQAAQRMLAYGFAADQILPTLRSIGDAAAMLGASPEVINRITLAFGQIKAKGTVQAEEMRQLAEAGIPAWEILAQKLGVTIPEAMKLVENRAVSATVAIDALTQGMNERFGGGMEKMATTWSGLMSTIKDEARFLAGSLTEGAFEALKGPLNTLATGLRTVREIVDDMPNSWKAAALGVALFAAAIGPVLIGVGLLASGVSSVIGLAVQVAGLAAGAASAFGFMGTSAALAGAAAGPVGLGGALVGLVSTIAGPLAIAIGAIGFGILAIEVLGLRGAVLDLLGDMVELAKVFGSAVWDSFRVSLVGIKAEISGFVNSAPVQLFLDVVRAAAVFQIGQMKQGAQMATLALRGNDISDLRAGVLATREKQIEDETATFFVGELGSRTGRLRDVHEEVFGPGIRKEIDAYNAKLKQSTEQAQKLQKAWIDMRSAQIQLQMAYNRPAPTMPMDIPRELPLNVGIGEIPLQRVGLPVDVGALGIPQARNEQWDREIAEEQRRAEEWQRTWEHAMGQVTADFARGMTDMLFTSRNIGEMMKGTFSQLARSITQSFMVEMFNPLTQQLQKWGKEAADIVKDKVLDKLPGFGKSAADKVTEKATDKAVDKATDKAVDKAVDAGTQAASGATQSGGSSAANAASNAASGGLIGAAVQAAGSIGVIMQLKRIEGTMNAVEYSTRAAEIHQRVMINSFFHPWTVLFQLFPWMLKHADIQTNLLSGIHTALGAKSDTPAAETGEVPALAGGGFLTKSGMLFGHKGEVVMPLEDLRAKMNQSILGRLAAQGIPGAVDKLKDFSAGVESVLAKLASGRMKGLASPLIDTASAMRGGITIQLSESPITIHAPASSSADIRSAVLSAMQTNREAFLEKLTAMIKGAWPAVVEAPNPA